MMTGTPARTVQVSAVDTVGMTVSDMNRAIDFYTSALTFEKLSDVEVAGRDYELLEVVFGARMRVVRLRLGDETIELTEYLAPRGRPMPADVRPNDHIFQHVAIIVSDMDQATPDCAGSTSNKPRADPSGCLTGIRTPEASRRSTSAIPIGTSSRSCTFPSARAWRSGIDRIASFSALITPPSSCPIRIGPWLSTATRSR